MEETDESGGQIKMVNLGFRIYHPQGNKYDELDNRPFFGWSERFDEWMPAYSPRIALHGTFSKKWDEQGNVMYVQDQNAVDDSMDLVLLNKEI